MPADSSSHYCAASGWPIPRAHRAGARGACRSSRSMTRRPRARRAGALRGHRVTWGRQRVALERGRQARIRPPRARGVARGRHMTHGMAPHAILVRLLLLPLHGGGQGGRPQRHPPRKHLVSPGARRLKNSDARRLAVALLRSFPEGPEASRLRNGAAPPGANRDPRVGDCVPTHPCTPRIKLSRDVPQYSRLR